MKIPKIERIFQGFALTGLMIFAAVVIGIVVLVALGLLLRVSHQRESVKVVNGTSFQIDATLVTESFDSSDRGDDLATLQIGDIDGSRS